MKEKFKKLPVSLKRQILSRIAAGCLFLLVFIVILIIADDFILSLPCLILSGFFIINGGTMLFHCIAGQYVVIQGTCTEIERTTLRKRIRAFYISSEEGTWKILTQRRMKGLAVGKDVIVYTASKTRVFEQNGITVIFSYYAYEICPVKAD